MNPNAADEKILYIKVRGITPEQVHYTLLINGAEPDGGPYVFPPRSKYSAKDFVVDGAYRVLSARVSRRKTGWLWLEVRKGSDEELINQWHKEKSMSGIDERERYNDRIVRVLELRKAQESLYKQQLKLTDELLGLNDD